MKSPEFFKNEIVGKSKNLTEESEFDPQELIDQVNKTKVRLDPDDFIGLSEYEKKWAKTIKEPLDNQDPLNKFLNQKIIGEQANIKEALELSEKEKSIKKLDEEIIANVKKRSEEENTKKEVKIRI